MTLGEEKMSITVSIDEATCQIAKANFISERYKNFGVECIGLSVYDVEAEPSRDYEIIVNLQFTIKQEGKIGEWGRGSKRSEDWYRKRSLLISLLKNLGYEAFPEKLGFSVR